MTTYMARSAKIEIRMSSGSGAYAGTHGRLALGPGGDGRVELALDAVAGP